MIDTLEPESGCGTTGPVQVPEFIKIGDFDQTDGPHKHFSEVHQTFC